MARHFQPAPPHAAYLEQRRARARILWRRRSARQLLAEIGVPGAGEMPAEIIDAWVCEFRRRGGAGVVGPLRRDLALDVALLMGLGAAEDGAVIVPLELWRRWPAARARLRLAFLLPGDRWGAA